MKKSILLVAFALCILLSACNNKKVDDALLSQTVKKESTVGATTDIDSDVVINNNTDEATAPETNNDTDEVFISDVNAPSNELSALNFDEIIFYESEDGKDYIELSIGDLTDFHKLSRYFDVDPDALCGWAIYPCGEENVSPFSSYDHGGIREKYSLINGTELLKSMGLIVYNEHYVIATTKQIDDLFAGENARKTYAGLYFNICPASRVRFEKTDDNLSR